MSGTKQPVDDCADDVIPEETEDGADDAPDAFENGDYQGNDGSEDFAEGFHVFSAQGKCDGYERGRMGGASILTRPPFGLAAGVSSGAGCTLASIGCSLAGARSS